MNYGHADHRQARRGPGRSWLPFLCLCLASCQALNQPPGAVEPGVPPAAAEGDTHRMAAKGDTHRMAAEGDTHRADEPVGEAADAEPAPGETVRSASWSVTVEDSPKAEPAGEPAYTLGSPRRRLAAEARPGVCLPAHRGFPRMPRLHRGCGGCGSCPPAGVSPPTCPMPATCTPYEDEFLCDGGDRELAVEVMPDWTVYGLDFEDTVAHYDTLDGRTEVEPSNRVCLYAPRFASVRQVTGLVVNRQRTSVAGYNLPVHLNSQEAVGGPTIMNQPLQPGRYVAAKGVQQFRERLRGNGLANAQSAAGLINRFKAYEDLQVIRDGRFDNSQKARLAEGHSAALVWTADQGVQVCIGNVTLVEVSGETAPQSAYRYDLPPGKPRMQVVKVASKRAAQPGDKVEFTIRFDNVGDEVVGNVTIIDNLTPRLAYVEDTAECSLPADFLTAENEGGSLVLRWEILDPIEVGQGGIIRFTCRVR